MPEKLPAAINCGAVTEGLWKDFLAGDRGEWTLRFKINGELSVEKKVESYIIRHFSHFERQSGFEEGKNKTIDIDITQFISEIPHDRAKYFVEMSLRVLFSDSPSMYETMEIAERLAIIKFRDYLDLDYESVLRADLPANVTARDIELYKSALKDSSPTLFQRLIGIDNPLAKESVDMTGAHKPTGLCFCILEKKDVEGPDPLQVPPEWVGSSAQWGSSLVVPKGLPQAGRIVDAVYENMAYGPLFSRFSGESFTTEKLFSFVDSPQLLYPFAPNPNVPHGIGPNEPQTLIRFRPLKFAERWAHLYNLMIQYIEQGDDRAAILFEALTYVFFAWAREPVHLDSEEPFAAENFHLADRRFGNFKHGLGNGWLEFLSLRQLFCEDIVWSPNHVVWYENMLRDYIMFCVWHMFRAARKGSTRHLFSDEWQMLGPKCESPLANMAAFAPSFTIGTIEFLKKITVVVSEVALEKLGTSFKSEGPHGRDTTDMVRKWFADHMYTAQIVEIFRKAPNGFRADQKRLFAALKAQPQPTPDDNQGDRKRQRNE